MPRLTGKLSTLDNNSPDLQWRPGLLPRLTDSTVRWAAAYNDLQWRPGLLPRLTLIAAICRTLRSGPAMEAGTIAPADVSISPAAASPMYPAMEAGTIAPADNKDDFLCNLCEDACNGGRDYCPG